MDDNQIIKFVEWFEARWKRAVPEQVFEIKSRQGLKGVKCFCQIGRFQVLIRLFICPGQILMEHAMAIEPEQPIYCDRYKISTASMGTGILTRLDQIRHDIAAGSDPQESCQKHLQNRLAEFQQNPLPYETLIRYHSQLPGKRIFMYRGGAPGLGKKR